MIVEPIACRFAEKWGEENVFYDSWSIRPGESIPGSINDFMTECNYFILFWSKNSSMSPMVEKEWATAFMRETYDGALIIVVRLDDSAIPPILSHKKYLDYSKDGPEVVIRKLVEIVEGGSGFLPTASTKNLKVSVAEKYDAVDIVIEVKYHMEPVSRYFITIDNEEQDVYLSSDKGEYTSGFNRIPMNGNIMFNGFFYSIPEPTALGFPIRLSIKAHGDAKVNFCGVYHEVSENVWDPLFVKKTIPSTDSPKF